MAYDAERQGERFTVSEGASSSCRKAWSST